MKKLITAGLGMILLLSAGCFEEKYKVDYCGKKHLYNGAKNSYRAGEEVTVYYDMIGTDTDYTFWLDNEPLDYSYNDKNGFVITFTMPGHDVKLECRTYNKMTALYDVDKEEMMDYSAFAYQQDDSIAYKLPEYGREYGSGTFLVEVKLETVSFKDKKVYGRDRDEIIISQGDKVPLGGANNLVLTVTEDNLGWFVCETNIPLVQSPDDPEEKTQFECRSFLRLYDLHCGDFVCVYTIEELVEY